MRILIPVLMMRAIVFLVGILLFVGSSAHASDYKAASALSKLNDPEVAALGEQLRQLMRCRNWTSDSGTKLSGASYAGLKEGKVGLKKVDGGNVIGVPFSRLSQNDRQFVLDLLEVKSELLNMIVYWFSVNWSDG